MATDKQTVKLSSDNAEVFEVPLKVACMSKTVENMIEDMTREQNFKIREDVVPLSNVNSKILSKIIAYCRFHSEFDDAAAKRAAGAAAGGRAAPAAAGGRAAPAAAAGKAAPSSSATTTSSSRSATSAAAAGTAAPALTEEDKKDFDAEFVKVDKATLFDLVLAANYLEVKPLLELLCSTVAGMLKGKTAEQIRSEFGIANDFSPQEEEAVRKANQWAFE